MATDNARGRLGKPKTGNLPPVNMERADGSHRGIVEFRLPKVHVKGDAAPAQSADTVHINVAVKKENRKRVKKFTLPRIEGVRAHVQSPDSSDVDAYYKKLYKEAESIKKLRGFGSVKGASSFVGKVIPFKSNSESRELLRELLTRSLALPFKVTRYPEDQHAALIEKLTGTLLAQHAEAVPDQPESAPLPRALPETAPETYQGLRGPETPPAFVKRVYGEWLGHGLDRAHIRNLDSTLYQAIVNWSRRNEWPSDVDLPTRSEKTTRWVERITTGDVSEDQLRDARNLLAAKQRHDAKRQK